MEASIRGLVRRRASEQCEYCGLSEDVVPFAAFHIEHIIPRQHGGSDDPTNLALACPHCNLHKGTNLAAIDPETNRAVMLYHPRSDLWHEHFDRHGDRIVGKTPEGRATARLLAMNTIERMDLRDRLGR